LPELDFEALIVDDCEIVRSEQRFAFRLLGGICMFEKCPKNKRSFDSKECLKLYFTETCAREWSFPNVAGEEQNQQAGGN